MPSTIPARGRGMEQYINTQTYYYNPQRMRRGGTHGHSGRGVSLTVDTQAEAEEEGTAILTWLRVGEGEGAELSGKRKSQVCGRGKTGPK